MTRPSLDPFRLFDSSAEPVRSQAKGAHLLTLSIARLKDNVNKWAPFACDRTGPADESKKTKRIQGWSRQNWLGGILIIVSLYIQP